MLQQTQASRVVPAYRAFLRRFPNLRALAAAPRREVLEAWDGLGYNRRAVSLSEAARSLARDHRGSVPSDPAALQRLPGIGPYTAAAVVSLAYGRPIPAVDTNVRRIIARVFAGAEPDDVPASRIRAFAEGWLDRVDPGAWNQALMDLGREICRPRPRCPECPLRSGCRFAAAGPKPRPSRRRQGAFEGSSRQVRGAVVRLLRSHRVASLGRLARDSGLPLDLVTVAVGALAAEGIVEAGPAALDGRARGRVRLAG
jgi:A/G-specific adenine glycosylase